MKTPITPVICSFALTAMTTAGLGYWWSLRQFITVVDANTTFQTNRNHAPLTPPAAPTLPVANPTNIAAIPAPPTPAPTAAQQAFYEALIAKMEGIQTQNRDLLDQLAETNRDLMKLEFRVDTHSESFRPLPVSEDRPFTTLNTEEGVLPPRAEPVVTPSNE